MEDRIETATTAKTADPTPAASNLAFAALRHRDFRRYFVTRMLAMMAHNVDHVISYWAIFQIFHSPTLGGIAVIGHWLPFLLFSVYAGALADRFDCRKLMHISQVLFISVSLSWGILIYTGSLQYWHAVVLLTVHGVGGTLWNPASQLIIHEIVGPQDLPSAIRLNATTQQLGFLLGPAVGGALLLLFSPAVGLMINAILYAPQTIWLLIVPYTGKNIEDSETSKRLRLGLRAMAGLAKTISGERRILAMVMLAGGASFFIGSAYQAQMPGFAERLGTNEAGFLYSMLFAANAAGAVIGGFLLEWKRLLQPRARSAIICASAYAACMGGFAMIPYYAPALIFLFLAGVFNIAFYSMALTIVQLYAPAHMRGSLLGLYNMSNLGLRTFSGVTVGVMGGILGIHWSLGLSAVVVVLITFALQAYLKQTRVDGELGDTKSVTV